MQPESYLENLNARLVKGLGQAPAEERAHHVAFLRAAQNADGGFSGREGGSDLYYTGFALRGLAVLDGWTPQLCERAAAFLKNSLTQQASVVDFFSLLYACLLVQAGGGPDVLAAAPADWPERVSALLESFRTADGGYAKTAGNASGSTYHTFLVGLCYQLLGRSYPKGHDVARFIQSRRREDGGYVEIAPMRRSGTNPTAAAVGALQLLEQQEPGVTHLSPAEREGVCEFLVEMPSLEGGLRANNRAPLADLLSTFTGAWTLDRLGFSDRLDRSEIRHYVESLAQATGGFRGGLWDESTDVEYTFYGLGVLALLNS